MIIGSRAVLKTVGQKWLRGSSPLLGAINLIINILKQSNRVTSIFGEKVNTLVLETSI